MNSTAHNPTFRDSLKVPLLSSGGFVVLPTTSTAHWRFTPSRGNYIGTYRNIFNYQTFSDPSFPWTFPDFCSRPTFSECLNAPLLFPSVVVVSPFEIPFTFHSDYRSRPTSINCPRFSFPPKSTHVHNILLEITDISWNILDFASEATDIQVFARFA